MPGTKTAAPRTSSAPRSFEPREYLLTALGQAASLCGHVERSLKSPTPGGFRLDPNGAHVFLSSTAWLLEQAGFTVLLPAWWTGKGTKQRLSVQAEVNSSTLQAGSGMSLAQIVQFDWKVALGDEVLTLEELRRLAQLKVPLVKVRGQWVQVHAEEIQALLALMERRASGEATLREVVQMALGAGKAPGGLPFGGVRADGLGRRVPLSTRREGTVR